MLSKTELFHRSTAPMDAPSYTCFEDEENFFQEKYSL